MTHCYACNREVSGTYYDPAKAAYVCFACLSADEIDRYPGWREREALKLERAERARQNFGLESRAS